MSDNTLFLRLEGPLQAWGAHVTAAVEGQAAENVVALRSAVE